MLLLSKQLEKARLENNRLRAFNRNLQRNKGLTFESAVEDLKTFLQEQPNRVFKASFSCPTKHKPLTKTVFDKDHREIAALVLSDFHTGEVVAPVEVVGMNKFNPIILANRLWSMVSKFIKIIRGHQSMYGIDKIWVPLLGDMISGSIHQELALTNALLDLPSAVLAAQIIIMILERLKTLGLPIEVDAVTGNHARQLVKLTTKKQAHLSLDWMVYVMVEGHFAGDPQVDIRIHQSQFALVEQFGHRFALDHLAAYPYGKLDELDERIRRIFDSPIYRDATGIQGTVVDFVIGADKHRGQRGPRYIVNGTVVGASEITTSWRLSPIKSEQVMFGISRKRPVTWDYFLEETGNISEETNNPFSRYVQEFLEQHGR